MKFTQDDIKAYQELRVRLDGVHVEALVAENELRSLVELVDQIWQNPPAHKLGAPKVISKTSRGSKEQIE
jgi:hypothetical protein